MTRVGILSFAHMHAFAYASCLRQLANVEFVGVADEEPVRGKTAAQRFAVGRKEHFIGHVALPCPSASSNARTQNSGGRSKADGTLLSFLYS